METIDIEKTKPKHKAEFISTNSNLLSTKELSFQNNGINENINLKSGRYGNGIKRILEFMVLIAIIVPAMCLILTISILLLIPNKGKVIFKQQRIGYKSKPFTLYKFRTLIDSIDINIEKNTTVIRENTHSLGFFLRKTGLDEILQIINIMKGDMNLIGPRPLLMKDLTHLTSIQLYKRHLIRPGILGLWQIKRNYSYDINYFKYDNFYIRKQSLSLDLYIIFGTIIYMFKGKGR